MGPGDFSGAERDERTTVRQRLGQAFPRHGGKRRQTLWRWLMSKCNHHRQANQTNRFVAPSQLPFGQRLLAFVGSHRPSVALIVSPDFKLWLRLNEQASMCLHSASIFETRERKHKNTPTVVWTIRPSLLLWLCMTRTSCLVKGLSVCKRDCFIPADHKQRFLCNAATKQATSQVELKVVY